MKGTPPPFFRLERKDGLIFFIWNDGKHMLLVDDLFPENLDFHKSSFGENLIGTTLIYSFKNMAFRKKNMKVFIAFNFPMISGGREPGGC